MKLALCASLLIAISIAPAQAQQDGLVALPNVYRVQFENEWVRIVRVNVPANANLPAHTHPPGFMVHLYLDDADHLVFEHDGSPFTVTRPAVSARSYRIGVATPESHAVLSTSARPSTYLRIELKTQGTENTRRRVPAPPLGTVTNATVESTGSQMRTTRITIAAGESFEIAATAEPAIVIALTEGLLLSGGARNNETLKLGQEFFVGAGQRQVLRNTGAVSLQVLRIDFLTKP